MSVETVKPYNSDGGKKDQIEKMFDNVAPTYDLLNRVLSLGIDESWRKKAIAKFDPTKAKNLLDVATGTADIAIRMSSQLSPDKIIGLDLSAKMLEYGQKKVNKKNLGDKIELVQGDSENLPFEDNTFDGVIVSFGVRNFENLEQGLSEIYRVLKKDGQIVVLEFSRPSMTPFKQLYNSYFKYILPNIGKLTSQDPKAYKYLYESVQAFPDGDAFLNMYKKLGFTETHSQPLTLGICTIYSAKK